MKDVQEIRRELWNSLDMNYVKLAAVWVGIFAVIECVMVAIVADGAEKWKALGLLLAISLLPILVFCLWRTFRIFRAAESYTFCTVKLSNPVGGKLRDTIRFRVVLNDAEGRSFVAYTNSIFHTHSGLMAPALEDYVNQNVLIAYNEKTESLVVIG